ncbi:hypothetical protein G3I76_09960, partial [Streptomyces sp. SID11233]|nr:hypothetical protein [Streptomyces sp. SID11233]
MLAMDVLASHGHEFPRGPGTVTDAVRGQQEVIVRAVVDALATRDAGNLTSVLRATRPLTSHGSTPEA